MSRPAALAAAALLALAAPALADRATPREPVPAERFLEIATGKTLLFERADGSVVEQYFDHRGRGTRHGRTAANAILGGPGVMYTEAGKFCEHWVEDIREMKFAPSCYAVVRAGDRYLLLADSGTDVVTMVPGYSIQ